MADEQNLDVKVNTPAVITQDDVLQLARPPIKVPAIQVDTSSTSSITAVLQQIKQIIETREGTRGSWVEKAVTWRDLIGNGLAKLNVNGIVYNPVPPPGGGVQPPTDPGNTPVYTPPPAPTGVQANGAMTNVIVEWDAPNYSYHGYAEIWRAESNVIGNAVLIGTSTSTIYVDEIGSGVTRYYWIRFVNKWDNAIKGPYQGTNGVAATTGVDVPYLLDQLTGQITQTQLDATLSAEIDQIDVLAIEVSSLSAGVAGAFDPFKTYYFDTTAEGWVADTDASVSHSGGHLIVNSTGTAPSIKLTSDLNPSLTGANYPVVKARIKRVSGSTWSGKLQWKTAGHGFSGSYQKVISDPTIAVGDYATIEWDCSAESDVTGSSILNYRLEFGAASDDDFDVDWIAFGRNAPGASVAMVGEETTARVAADSAEVSHRELLAAKIIGTTDPDDIDGIADLTAGLIYEEKTVRISEDSAIVSSVDTLSTTVDGHTTTLQTQSSSIDGLRAQYTVKIDNNGYVSGFGLASEPRQGPPGGIISTFGIRADTFYIASPTGPGITPTMPFVVKTTSWVSDGGITNPPGIYMTSAYIADGQITNAKIGNLAVDDAKIANLSAAKITSGEIAADRLNANDITAKVISVDAAKITTGVIGGNLFSQSYSPGLYGWVMRQDGTAELNNVVVRGTVYASAGVFSGTLSAATGTFSGTVNASTINGGTVNSATINSAVINGGSVNGTVGTFSGVLAGTISASAVNIVKSLHIEQNAVIIPVANESVTTVLYGNLTWQNMLSCSITVYEFTRLYIDFDCVMWTQQLPEDQYPINWAFRLLDTGGTPILYVGPGYYYGSEGMKQPVISFGRAWNVNAGSHTFGVQFYGLNQNIVAAYPFMRIIGARKQ